MSLKILFLSHKFYPDIGGIETMSEILAVAFHKAGHEVHVVTHTANSGNMKFPYLVIRSPSTLKLFKEHAWADIVFENNPCLQLSLPGLLFRKPSIVVLHTWLSRTDGNISWQDRLKYIWLKRATQVISCSNIIRERCFPSSMVIDNPYDENVFKIIPEIVKNRKFLFLGRLVSDKGARLAVKAFNQLLNNTKGKSDLSLTIIGDGPERESIGSLISEYDLHEQITLTGALSGDLLVKCINQHEIILVPSIWEEPFGLVALEGMACGCIPVASNSGGLPDAVGKAGLLFEKGNLDSLVSTIEQLLDDKVLEANLKKEAIAHLASHTSAFITKSYLNVIESLSVN